jgi:hypothetical protein
MPPIAGPPISPQAQAQMGPPGPPGGPAFGPGIGAAMQDQGKNQIDIAINTVEKILKGINNETFQSHVTQALSILRQGALKSGAAGPMSGPGAPPPGAGPPGEGAGPPPPQPQLPPSAGMMPG